MRRKGRKKNIFPKIIFIALTFLSFVSISYSYLSATLKITGKVTGKYNEQNFTYASGSNPNLAINIARINNWQEGSLYKYQYSIKLTNVGPNVVNNFKIVIDFLNKIDSISIWNYDATISNRTLNISSQDYQISPQQSITIDFILSSSFANQMIKTVKLEIVDSSKVVTLDQFNVKFNITNGWGNYTYQYDVVLTNKTGAKINGWQLDITLPLQTDYITGWNAIFAYRDNVLSIKNESYNGKINNNSSIIIGLQLSTNTINYIPTNNIRIIVR